MIGVSLELCVVRRKPQKSGNGLFGRDLRPFRKAGSDLRCLFLPFVFQGSCELS